MFAYVSTTWSIRKDTSGTLTTHQHEKRDWSFPLACLLPWNVNILKRSAPPISHFFFSHVRSNPFVRILYLTGYSDKRALLAVDFISQYFCCAINSPNWWCCQRRAQVATTPLRQHFRLQTAVDVTASIKSPCELSSIVLVRVIKYVRVTAIRSIDQYQTMLARSRNLFFEYLSSSFIAFMFVS